MKSKKVKASAKPRGSIQAAFQQQLQEREILEKECNVEKPKLEKCFVISEIDCHLHNVLRVFLDSSIAQTKNQRQQQHAARSDFLYAVRAISLTTDGTLPTKDIYELILNQIQESDCVSTTIHAASVLHQLDKCFPYTHFTEAGAPGETHQGTLQVAEQVWTPMDRYELTRVVNDSHLKPRLSGDVDYGNLAYVVEKLSDILDPPREKKHMDCERLVNTGIEKLGLSVMFLHLTNFFIKDFNNRLQVYQEHKDIKQLRKSLLNRFLEAQSKINRSHLWEQLLRIINVSANTVLNHEDSETSQTKNGKNNTEKSSDNARSCEIAPGDNSTNGSQEIDSSGRNRKRVRKEAPLDEEIITGPRRSTRRKMENGKDKHSEIQKGGGNLGPDLGLQDDDHLSGFQNYFYSPSQFCELAQGFISLVLELYEALETDKAHSRFANEWMDLMEKLLSSWNESEPEEKSNFIATMVRPKQKMDFLLFLFQRTAFKASSDVVNSKSKSSLKVDDLLMWISQLEDRTTRKRTNKLDQRLLSVILSHSLEAHLRICVQAGSQSKAVKSSNGSLRALIVAATSAIREVYKGELSSSTENSLLAAEALAQVADS